MARRKYITGALVEARNSKYGKGFGIIISGPEQRATTAHGYARYEGTQEWFKIHWFEKPGNVDSYHMRRGNGQVEMTQNQIKLLRKR